MTFNYFFSKNFLLDPTPVYKSELFLPLLIAFSLMILLAIFIAFQKAQIKKIVKRFFNPLLTNGILGLIYVFSRHESLPYLASRFFLLLIVLIFFVWMSVLLVNLARFVPKQSTFLKNEERYRKYLPKNSKIKTQKLK